MFKFVSLLWHFICHGHFPKYEAWSRTGFQLSQLTGLWLGLPKGAEYELSVKFVRFCRHCHKMQEVERIEYPQSRDEGIALANKISEAYGVQLPRLVSTSAKTKEN